MTTVKQIERAWTARTYEKLFRELVSSRPESAFKLEVETSRSALAAAMGVIRLEELNQSHVPLYGKLLRALIATQDADGGWGDPVSTAMCLRALLCGQGAGEAVERGMTYLANLQKDEGIWPQVPLRRMPADAYVSAFVLYQLGDNARFREAVRFVDALNWFEAHQSSLDESTRELWERASLKCNLWVAHSADAEHGALVCS